MPPHSDTDEEVIPDLVPNVSDVHTLYPPKQSLSDEETDKEVAQICQTPVYYHLRSLMSQHHHYYTHYGLDAIDEQLHKRHRKTFPVEAVHTSEH